MLKSFLMSVEYEKGKEELRVRLVAACVSNLRQLQERQVQTSFAFSQKNGEQPKDPRTMTFLPKIRSGLSYLRPTWNQFQYENGRLTREKIQVVNLSEPERAVPDTKVEIELEQIPFDKFSEDDLAAAAKKIERFLTPQQNQNSAIA